MNIRADVQPKTVILKRGSDKRGCTQGRREISEALGRKRKTRPLQAHAEKFEDLQKNAAGLTLSGPLDFETLGAIYPCPFSGVLGAQCERSVFVSTRNIVSFLISTALSNI